MSDDIKETPKPAKTGKAGASVVDPLAAVISALGAEGSSNAERKQARAEFSAIAEAGRPWEQLPSGLKSSARHDIGRLADGADAGAAIAASGYSEGVASRLLRDLGRF